MQPHSTWIEIEAKSSKTAIMSYLGHPQGNCARLVSFALDVVVIIIIIIIIIAAFQAGFQVAVNSKLLGQFVIIIIIIII